MFYSTKVQHQVGWMITATAVKPWIFHKAAYLWKYRSFICNHHHLKFHSKTSFAFSDCRNELVLLHQQVHRLLWNFHFHPAQTLWHGQFVPRRTSQHYAGKWFKGISFVKNFWVAKLSYLFLRFQVSVWWGVKFLAGKKL